MRKFLLLLILVFCRPLPAENLFFGMEELYTMALENNPLLAEKQAVQKASLFRAKEAGSRRGPTLNFESDFSYISNPDTLTVEAGSLGTLDLSPLGGPVTAMPSDDTTFTMGGNTFYDFRLILDQPLYAWGKIHHAYEALKEGASAAAEDTERTKERLRTEIMINCHVLHYLKEIELAASRRNELISRLERIAADNFSNGMILRTEYLDVRTGQRESELSLARIAQQIDQTVLNLSYLTGRELSAVMIRTMDFEPQGESSRDILMDLALSHNRDLSMLRFNINAEEHKNRMQRGEYYFKPDLAFRMELRYSGSRFPFLQEDWDIENRENLTLTLAVRAPLADFGTMYYKLKATDSDREAALALYNSSVEQIEQAIRTTLSDIEMNRINISYYRDLLETDRQIIAQKEKEWLSGYGDERTLLAEQIEMQTHIIALNSELISLGSNRIKLDSITGNVNK